MSLKTTGIVLLVSALASLSFIIPSRHSAPLISNNSIVEISAYDSLHLELSGLSKEAYEFAVRGMDKLQKAGKLADPSIVSIIDFTQPSTQKRLYIIDLKHYKVLFNTWVAHGVNSGREMAQSFSNTMSSLKSSPGFYVTGQTYIGGHGYSLKLNGMERGINDKASDRAIVLHGADYVSQAFISNTGCLGRSWGCPAVSTKEVTPIINTIKNGTCLFIYPPDKNYYQHSFLIGA